MRSPWPCCACAASPRRISPAHTRAAPPPASPPAPRAWADALAVALLRLRGFTEEDFARSPPGGSLGRRLLLHVEDVMHTGAEVPSVGPDDPGSGAGGGGGEE